MIGDTAQNHNVHLLQHLTHIVGILGPLWAFSCFGFESMNAVLKNLIHGTGKVISQVNDILIILKSLTNSYYSAMSLSSSGSTMLAWLAFSMAVSVMTRIEFGRLD